MKGINTAGQSPAPGFSNLWFEKLSAAELRGIVPFDDMPCSVMRKPAFAQLSLRQSIKNISKTS